MPLLAENQPVIRQCYFIKTAPTLGGRINQNQFGERRRRWREDGGGGGELQRGGEDGGVGRVRGGAGRGGGGQLSRGRGAAGGRAAGSGYRDTKKGGTDVAFDFDTLNGIRAVMWGYLSPFTLVHCAAPARPAPFGPSVCSSRAKPDSGRGQAAFKGLTNNYAPLRRRLPLRTHQTRDSARVGKGAGRRR